MTRLTNCPLTFEFIQWFVVGVRMTRLTTIDLSLGIKQCFGVCVLLTSSTTMTTMPLAVRI